MESAVQNGIKKKLEAQGWYVVKIMRLSENGWPDLMALKDGEIRFIEVKDKGKKPTPLQLYRIEQLKKMGFKANWYDNENEI